MPICIEDILTLKTTQSFTLIAGKRGLRKTVDVIDMLDFGWTREKEFTAHYLERRPIFDDRSFVISSLQFAADNPDKLYNAVCKLIQCGVSGMAFKPAFYYDLPAKICRLADSRDFPIFRIDDYAMTYREIICDISDAIRLNKNIDEISVYLSRMTYENLNVEEIADIAAKISPYFRGNARISLLFPKDAHTHQLKLDYVVRTFRQYEEFKGKAALSSVELSGERGLAVVVTSDAEKEGIFDTIESTVISACGIDVNEMRHSTSCVHPTFTALNQCMIEAWYAYIASCIMERLSINYCQLGDLSFLIPMVNNPYLRSFMQNYLQPIILQEESLQTAITVVRAGGDYTKAAERLCVHKNTVRYRMGKIKELLSPADSENDFYAKLSSAIKVYLIIQKQALCE